LLLWSNRTLSFWDYRPDPIRGAGVLEQTAQTIIQEQRKITMVEFQKAEEAREKAERHRGIAPIASR
jgi:hypothetical protein